MSILASGAVMNPEEFTGVIAVGGAFSVALVAIVAGATKAIFKTRAREQTKRELAAYVAEGSMRPEDAEKILRSDQRPGGGPSCC